MFSRQTLAALSLVASLALATTACSSGSGNSENTGGGTQNTDSAQDKGQGTPSAAPTQQDGEQIVLSLCNGTDYNSQRRIIRVNLADGSTSTNEDRYFSVEPEKYDTGIAQCNSPFTGAQQALAYADNFSKLAVTYNKDNISKHIGYEDASPTPLNTVTTVSGAADNVSFHDLSGAGDLTANPDNLAGGIGPDGRIYFGDYTEATNEYSLKSVSLKGGDIKLYKKLSGDGARDSYFQPGATTPTLIPSGGLVDSDTQYLNNKDFGFSAYDTTVRAGSKKQLEADKGTPFETTDSTPAPSPFKPINTTSYYGYTDHTIDKVTLAGGKIHKDNILTIGATIGDAPRLTVDGKYIMFVANNGLYRLPVGSNKATTADKIWSTSNPNDISLNILGTTTATK